MIALLNKINEHGILLELEEGKLELYTENTQVDPNLLQEIKDNKQALIDYLSRSAQADAAQEQEYEIPVAPPQDSYPLSSAQRQLWLISQFELANVAYNSLGAYQLMGALNKESLTKAFSSLVERHEILRTYFCQNEEGDPRQFIVPTEESELSVTDHDLRGVEDQDKAIRKILQQQAGTPFHLSEAPLLRIVLIQTADEEFLLLHVMHHIISDAWSMEVLSRELFVLYNGICHSTTPHLPPLRVQYKDYAQWQQEQLATEEMKRHQGYWLEQFQGELPVLDRLGDKNRPAFKTYNGKVLERILDRNAFVQLQQIAKEEGATLFMTLLAAVKALLFRYTGQQDIILGSATAGRDHLDLENQIGYYINPLALRTRFEAVDGFRELLKRVKDTTLGAYEHQLYPFDQLIEDLQLSQNLSRSPLFDVSVLLQNTNTINYDKGEQAAVMQGIQIQDYKLDVLSSSKFDISIGFMASGEDLFFSMDYNTDVFSDEWIQTFANHFEQLVASIIQQPSLSIAQLPYLTAEEKHSLCHTFNDTQKDFAKDISFLDLFQQQLAAHPDHPAVSFHGNTLSYRELEERSNQLGHYLHQQYDVKADELIGIFMEPSVERVIAILGVLKTGGAYVPIDTNYPEARVEFMQEDSQCKLLLDEDEFQMFHMMRSGYDNSKAPVQASPQDLAYVIYTSGSTGQPKGVMIEHRQLVNLCQWHQHEYELTAKDRTTHCAGFGFDASVWEIFSSLGSGATLYIVPNDVRANVEQLNDFFVENQITSTFLPTPLYEQFAEVEQPSAHLRLVLTGGDRLTRFQQAHYRLYNNYGPTENAVVATCTEITEQSDAPPIGRPIANVRAYVLDAWDNLLPIGVPGELCIAGASLARGYWDKPELTAERFYNPRLDTEERIYRTGDLVKWLPDGQLAFLGRVDKQVKIRGHRIELGEIEHAIKEFDQLKEAAVIAVDVSSSEKELVAFLVADQPIEVDALKTQLATQLPAYMIPVRFIQLDALPLTPNGKMDRKKLTALGQQQEGPQQLYVAPRNEWEEGLVEIWEEVFVRDKIGVKDNFFDLGGHSLRATRMSTLVQKKFDLLLPLEDIFTKQTIEQLAVELQQLSVPVSVDENKSVEII